jgi:hypothetical protein
MRVKVTPTSGKETLDTWWFHLQRGVRTQCRVAPHAGEGTRPGAHHERRGVCESALKPRQAGKTQGRNARVPNRTWEIRLSAIIEGPAKRSHGGIVNSPCNRKSKCDNPASKAGARGHPNRPVSGERIISAIDGTPSWHYSWPRSVPAGACHPTGVLRKRA